MEIKSVNGNDYYYQRDKVVKKQDETKLNTEELKKKPSDKLELSTEADKLQTIQSKLASNVYNRPEILRDVAHRLSKLYPPEGKSGK